MTSERQFDALLRSWLEESAPSGQPQGLLEAVVTATSHTRPRPTWLVGLRGEPMPEVGRSGLYRFAPLALTATALVVAILIGVGLILRSPNVGPSPIPGPAKSATPEPTAHTATWTATGSMIEARSDFTATRLADGKVLVAGGHMGVNISSPGMATAELYDPATGTWTATGRMLTGRSRLSATLLPDGKVLVAGGNVDSSASLGARCCLASAELYDPSTGTWSATGSMIDARVAHTATLLLDGRVLVAAGDSAHINGEPGAELYDPISGSWTATGTMKVDGLYGQTAALLANGKVLVVGGHNGNAAPELYDPSSGSWSALDCAVGSPDGEGRCGNPGVWGTATPLPDGRVLVTGDSLGAALYDSGAGTWSPTGRPVVANDSPDPYNHLRSLLLLNGTVLLLDNTEAGDSAQLYDPKTGIWTAAARLTTVRYGAVATLLVDGRVLLVGGYSTTFPDSPLASAELYDPGSGS
jgi:hypothetical protein